MTSPSGQPGSGSRSNIKSGSPFETSIGFSRAVRVGRRVVVSGTAPIWADGTCPPDVGEQARRCCEIIVAALASAGATPADVVRTRIYLMSAADAAAVGEVHAEFFGAASPAATMIVVAGLLDPRWRVELEAEAELLTSEPGTSAGGPETSGTSP
jgi:enamine deaminase RidA (YjgF/YER057c/UK114 family)